MILIISKVESMTEVLKLKLNEKTESLVSNSIKVLMLIYQLGECSMRDIVKAAGGMSATTVFRHVNELQKMGLVEIINTKSRVGTRKKIVRITDKGLQVINHIMKLNELLS